MEAADIEKIPMKDSMKTLFETYQADMEHSDIDGTISNCHIKVASNSNYCILQLFYSGPWFGDVGHFS